MPTLSTSLGQFELSTDPNLLQLDSIHELLKRTPWARDRPRAVVEKTIKNSLCYGIYTDVAQSRIQIGFARIVTDYCTFAYLCDVVIDENYRGFGLSKWMMENVMKHPELAHLRRFLLATQDAHSLYSRYGFMPLWEEERARYMVIHEGRKSDLPAETLEFADLGQDLEKSGTPPSASL